MRIRDRRRFGRHLRRAVGLPLLVALIAGVLPLTVPGNAAAVDSPSLTLTESGPTIANVGDTITYSFSFTNSGARLHFTVVTDDSNLCDSGPTYQSGDDNADGYLEIGETWVEACSHTVTLLDPDPLPNQATVSGLDDSAQSYSDSDVFTVNIVHPDVTVTKTGSAAVSAGDPVTYTVTLTVGGDSGSIGRGVMLLDALPGGLTWTINPSVNGCGIANGVLTCGFGDLPFGASRTVSVQATTGVADCGGLSNTATVSATNELVTDNNTATATTAVACPDVTVTKTADDGTISAGDTATFTLTVSSSGATASSVTLLDALPSGVIWSINSAGSGCTILNGVLSCTFASVAVGAPVSVQVSGATDSADCGTLSNTATVSAANEPAGNSSNNSSTATIVVNCPVVVHPSIGVTVSATPNPVHVGHSVTFVYIVTNTGDVPLTGVTAVDSQSGSVGTATSLALGQSVVFIRTVRAKTAGMFTHLVVASAQDALAHSVVGTDSVTLTVVPPRGPRPH